MNRRRFLHGVAAAASAFAAFSAKAQGAWVPTKPIRIIVSSSPGALLDVAARLFAEQMSAQLKQPVVVENQAGASGLLAARNVARSTPDGYTLLASANTILTVPLLDKAAGYSMSDFAAVGEMARAPSLLVVSGASPFKSMADLVAEAKKAPGHVSYGSGGRGTTSHLPVEIFAKQAGITLLHIPYKGVAQAVPDTVSNRVDFMMGTATSLAGLVASGDLRVLAISSETRSSKFPDVPTFKELGYPGATFEIWVSLFAPAGIPKTVRSTLAEAIAAARSDKALIGRLDDMGQVISNRTPEQFEAGMKAEEEVYRQLIKEANITLE